MKKLTALAVALGLALPASATAEDLSPTPAELQRDHAIAVVYWHTELNPQVLMAPLPPVYAAQANYPGAIELSSQRDWRDFPEVTCRTYVHEYGHLVLGPTYFAATNPGDPAHSPDPNNIMYGGGEPGNGPPPTVEQELQQNRTVGCFSCAVETSMNYEPCHLTLVASPARHHTRRRKHHHHHTPTSSPLPLL